ncbi:MAG: cadherin repeat domain-containing protein, partial [Promethearchaeota archaeon]
VLEASNGDFVLIGSTESYGPGVPSTPSKFSIPSNFWVVRTNATGYMLWYRTYHHDDFGYEYGFAGVECASGDFVFAGYTYSISTDRRDFWLIKTDNTGEHIWNETYGWSDSEDRLREMIAYSSGGFVLVGQTNHTSSGQTDIWLVYTDNSGNQVWNESYGSDYDDWCYGLADCSLGIAVYGSAESATPNVYDSWLFVLPDGVAPTWNPAPTDQTVLFGVPFSYDLNATDPWTLTWAINDTTNFAIDQDGVVTNAVTLAVGVYALRITVTDPAGNALIGTFLVTVTAPAQIPLLLYIGIAVIVIIIVVLLIYFMRRSGKSK